MDKNFFLDKCILSYYAQINSFIIQLCIMLCLRVIMPQMFYNVISTLHWNITVGPGRCLIPCVTMVGRACSSFSIEKDNCSEVCSPVSSLRGISEHYSMSHSLYYLCSHLAQVWVEVLFEPKQSKGKYSVDCKVGRFVE